MQGHRGTHVCRDIEMCEELGDTCAGTWGTHVCVVTCVRTWGTRVCRDVCEKLGYMCVWGHACEELGDTRVCWDLGTRVCRDMCVST